MSTARAPRNRFLCNHNRPSFSPPTRANSERHRLRLVTRDRWTAAARRPQLSSMIGSTKPLAAPLHPPCPSGRRLAPPSCAPDSSPALTPAVERPGQSQSDGAPPPPRPDVVASSLALRASPQLNRWSRSRALRSNRRPRLESALSSSSAASVTKTSRPEDAAVAVEDGEDDDVCVEKGCCLCCLGSIAAGIFWLKFYRLKVGCRLGSKRIGHLLPPWGLSTTPKTYNKLATQITLPPSYIAPEDTGKISGTIWTEEVVLHSTTAASRSGEAMQRKMAQPFEAKHQGNQLPVPLVPIIGKGVLEEEVMVSHTWGIAAAGSNTSCFTRTEADPVSFINMVTPPTIEVHRHSCIIHSVPSLPSATHGSMRRMTFFSLISPVLRLQLRRFEYMRDTMVKLPHELETARINELLGNIQAVVTPEMNQTTIIEEFDKGHQLEEVKTVNEQVVVPPVKNLSKQKSQQIQED
ncbi:hypothetical protein ZEAMMB73_Zm00001d017024 [Zea mays]|uniref:Uncharacterized protein n=1 Tax=Zea mays TaxID=4577 RepID=A0A1D6HBQ8_MAIZE|nr:hypothetical protein ZEAMMB73_Zm00001d017024 [Zea mays]